MSGAPHRPQWSLSTQIRLRIKHFLSSKVYQQRERERETEMLKISMRRKLPGETRRLGFLYDFGEEEDAILVGAGKDLLARMSKVKIAIFTKMPLFYSTY